MTISSFIKIDSPQSRSQSVREKDREGSRNLLWGDGETGPEAWAGDRNRVFMQSRQPRALEKGGDREQGPGTGADETARTGSRGGGEAGAPAPRGSPPSTPAPTGPTSNETQPQAPGFPHSPGVRRRHSPFA